MQDLERLASAERMIPHAPVQASRTITIAAPIDKVWEIQTDVSRWPTWYPYLRDAKLGGPFGPGATISYGGLLGHRLMLAKVRSPELVMVYGQYLGYSAISRWDFQPVGRSATMVTFAESSVGFLIATLYGNGRLGEHLGRWLAALKTSAETSPTR